MTNWDLVEESLQQTKRRFEEYGGYPSYEFKQERIAEVEEAIDAIRALREAQHKEAA